MIDRREFIQKSALAGAAILYFPELMAGEGNYFAKNNYYPLRIEDNSLINTPVPKGKRSPFGWDQFAIKSSGEGTIIQFPNLPNQVSGKIYIRFLFALEMLDKREMTIVLAKSGRLVADCPIWYANSLQLFEFELKADPKELKSEGVKIHVKNSGDTVYCYVFDENMPGSHLYIENAGVKTNPQEAYFSKLMSLWSIHPFGWMSGCVTDGLEALTASKKFPKAERVINDHLNHFFPDDNNLIYEWYDSDIRDNVFNNPEGGLPFAALVRRRPNHSAIKTYTDFCEGRISNGKTKSGSLTTEGIYHLAYPLAMIAKEKKNNTWADIALIEIEDRINLLAAGDTVHQGASKDGKRTQFSNWSRGYAWFMLGLARSFSTLNSINSFKGDPRMKLIKDTFEYYASLAIKHRGADGSWGSYIHLPETKFDASGTAGITSALMYAKSYGWNIDFDNQAKMKTRKRLENSLTSDGFLKGSCQTNRGYDELQKGDFRVISQYAMGLMAHLYI